MYGLAQKLFYFFAGFLLLTGLFVLTPNNSAEVSALQDQIKHEFKIAWIQTIGDQPYFSDLFAVIEGVNAFYDNAATQMIALLEDQTGSDQDFARVLVQTYNTFAAVFSQDRGEVIASEDLANFMTEPALTNIVPQAEPQVAGISTVKEISEPVNQDMPWVTIKDNLTGQLYCLAVYNGEVNKYLGPCKYDGYY